MDLRERPCPLCRSSENARVVFEEKIDHGRIGKFAFASRKVPEYMHYRLLLCATCDTLYASPAPTAEALARAYDSAGYDSDTEAGFAARTYAHYLANHLLPALGRREGALDIGTGNGSFLAELLDVGFTGVRGVEPSAAPIAVASPRVRPLLRQGMFRASDVASSSLSLVSCFMTIEHVADPLTLAKDAFRLLRPGGALYLVSHSHRSLLTKVLGDHSPIFDIEHLQLFSPRSLRNLLAKAGFERIDVVPIANRYPLHYWLKLLPLPESSRRAVSTAIGRLHVDTLPIPLRAGNLATFGFKP